MSVHRHRYALYRIRGFRTIGRATATENSISSGILDCRYNRAWGSDAFHPHGLIFEVSAGFFDSCRGVSSAGAGVVWGDALPPMAFTAADTDL